MLRGTNQLLLNEATIIEAVQEYLESRTKNVAPIVTSVDIVAFEGERHFQVRVEEDKGDP